MATNLGKPLRLRSDSTAQLQLTRSANTRSLTVNASGQLELDGTVIANTLASSGATITGGTINGTPVGGTTAAAGAFTTLTASSTATLNTLASSGATITGGTINATPIGGTTPAAGAFTTLAASSPASFAAGSTTLPSITRTGDTDTGFWFPAANTVAVSTDGVERQRWGATGTTVAGVPINLDVLAAAENIMAAIEELRQELWRLTDGYGATRRILTGEIIESTVAAGSPILRAIATSDTPTKDPTSDAPAGWLEIQVAGNSRYIPFYE